jgi:heme-degrading monooxygenase HmoA
MFITITTSIVDEELSRKVEKFLESFLPRMREQPGVTAIYHTANRDKGEESTIVIWESEEVLEAFQQSDLIKEAMDFKKKYTVVSTGEAYPIMLAL